MAPLHGGIHNKNNCSQSCVRTELRHDCICIRFGEQLYGVIRLTVVYRKYPESTTSFTR